MKRVLPSLILLLVMSLSVASLFSLSAYAVDPLDVSCAGAASASPACDRGNGTNPISGSTGIIKRVAVLISVITGIASGILILIGTIKYITSAGDANSVSSAKKTIIYALVGLVVTLFAQAIIVFVINRIK